MYYNYEHRHTGIGLHTPASVHCGTAHQVRALRQATLDAAYGCPSRTVRPPPTAPADLPTQARLPEMMGTRGSG